MGTQDPARNGQARANKRTEPATRHELVLPAELPFGSWNHSPTKTYGETEPQFPVPLAGVSLPFLFQQAQCKPVLRAGPRVMPKAALCNCGVHQTSWMSNSPSKAQTEPFWYIKSIQQGPSHFCPDLQTLIAFIIAPGGLQTKCNFNELLELFLGKDH